MGWSGQRTTKCMFGVIFLGKSVGKAYSGRQNHYYISCSIAKALLEADKCLIVMQIEVGLLSPMIQAITVTTTGTYMYEFVN